MSIPEIPAPPPFIPVPPPIPDAPPVGDAPAAAPLDKETKKLANPKRYFADLAPNIDQLLNYQIAAWQLPLQGGSEEKIQRAAERQIRYLAYILTEHSILTDCTKLIQALSRYTNEELALLIQLHKETCLEPNDKAASKIVSPLEKLYLRTNRPGWETAFMQHPEELGKALVAEKERREREGIVITLESRPHSEKAHVRIAEAQPEQKTELKPAAKLNMDELIQRQQQRAALPAAPKKTLRRQQYKQTLRGAGVNLFAGLLKPAALRPVREPSASAAPIPVFLRPVKKVATPPPEAPAQQ